MLPPPPARIRIPATLSVAATVREGGRDLASNMGVYPIDAPFPLSVPCPAYVSVEHSDSRCVNYNTTKVSVSVMVPCDPTAQAIQQAEHWASEQVQTFIEQEKVMVGGTYEGYVARGLAARPEASTAPAPSPAPPHPSQAAQTPMGSLPPPRNNPAPAGSPGILRPNL